MGRWRALLVAACVLAAGCSGGPGVWSSPGSEPTRTLTPAPVPETPALSLTSVPGVSPDGSIDTRRLARAHVSAVGARTYTWTFRLRRTDPQTGQRVVNATRRVRVGERATLVEDERFRDAHPNQTVYLTDRTGYQRFRGSETTLVLNDSRPDRRYVFAPSMLRLTLRSEGYRLAVVERDRRRYLRLHHPAAAPGSDDLNDSYTATATVARSGFVRSLSVSYTDLRGHHVTLRYRYTAIGSTTVSTPSWVSHLRERANATDQPRPQTSVDTPPTATNRSG
jgi:hypothetical protein